MVAHLAVAAAHVAVTINPLGLRSRDPDHALQVAVGRIAGQLTDTTQHNIFVAAKQLLADGKVTA
jgi:hypothetical protein